MTKRERQLHSMLNYFEISTGGTKDEGMTKAEKKKFTDSINTAYDSAVIDELISKIKGTKKNDSEMDEPFLGEEDEGFSTEDFIQPFDDNSLTPKQKKSPEIEEFLSWLSGVLYSADHKVTVTTDKNGITRIKMEQIKKGGKK